jgi:hypothetical protein
LTSALRFGVLVDPVRPTRMNRNVRGDRAEFFFCNAPIRLWEAGLSDPTLMKRRRLMSSLGPDEARSSHQLTPFTLVATTGAKSGS